MDVKIGNFRFLLDKKSMIGSCYDVSDRRRIRRKELVIPSHVTYEGKTFEIVEISSGGFYKYRGLVEVIIPDTIREIKYGAFADCINLKYVYIPKSVKVIEEHCFKNCTDLSKIEFEGDINKIDIKPFAFWNTELEFRNRCTRLTIDDTYYFGNILYSVSPEITTLEIKPGTKSVVLNSCSAVDIIFPDSVDFIYIESNYKLERLHFSSIEHYLNNVHLEIPLWSGGVGFVDLFFGGKLEKNIKLPQSTVELGRYKFSGSSIESIVLNKDIKKIDPSCFRRVKLEISSIYLPRNIDTNWLCCCNFKEIKLNFSTLIKCCGSINSNKLSSLVIYLDDLYDVSKLYNLDLRFIKRVELVITSSKIDTIELRDLIYFILGRIGSGSKVVLVGEEFLEISGGPIVTTNIIEVDDYLVSYYQNNPIWKYFNIVSRTDSDLNYIIIDDNTCKVTFKLDISGDNSYLGIVKIPREKEIDGKLYKVVGVDDFAFSNCYGLEEVVLYEDQEISDLAFFSNSDVKLIRV